MVLKETVEPEEELVSLAVKDLLDLQVLLVNLDLPAPEAAMASQERLAVQANLVLLDPEETLAQEVILAQEEAQDPEEMLALRDLLAQLVNPGRQALLDLQGNLVCVEILVVQVLQVHEDSQAHPDHRGLLGQQASLVNEEIREAKEHQEVPVRRVHQVNEEIPALPVQLVRRGLKDSLDLPD